MRAIVVIFGNAGNGKDTLADLIGHKLLEHGSTLRLAFADPLKEAALHLLGLTREVVWGTADVKEREVAYGRTVRRWLQWLGTEVGRNQIHPSVWVHRTADTALDPSQRGMFAVVSDGRFENERTDLETYARTKAQGVAVYNILIVRPGREPKGRMPSRLWKTIAFFARFVGREVAFIHPSEAEVFTMRQRALAGERLFWEVVMNDGTLDDLERKAEEIVAKILA